MANDVLLARALGVALTGEQLVLEGRSTLVADLAAAGFDAARLRDLRRDAQAAQRPWPFPVPIEVLREIGFARFDAALADARATLGLQGLVAATPSRRELDRDEQRLSADRPPHWG